MVDKLEEFIVACADWIWGLPLLILIMGGGLTLLIISRGLPYLYLKHAINVLKGKYDEGTDLGQISHYEALSTALAATVGMGNIAGVAIAIKVGGPGAVFWMWVSALVGVVTKYFTCTLAIMYRGKDSAGEIQGGPMYVIVEGLGKQWKFLASFFCLAGLIGCLPVFNANQLNQAIHDIVLQDFGITQSLFSNTCVGLLLIAMVGIVVLGGLKRIATVASKLVPFMVVVYFFAVIAIMFQNFEKIPTYLTMIFTNAFTAENYSGDPMLGGALGGLIVLGLRRAAFSNEAGIGTASMAHGAAKTSEPVHEGLVAMLGPIIDTLIVCTLTALAILMTDVWLTTESNGVTLTAKAFEASFPIFGKYILLICIASFSISSLFTYSYFGTKCFSFLAGANKSHWYNTPYVISILIGTSLSMTAIISLIDFSYALMAIPTMLSTILLAPKVMEVTRKYFKSL
jgi:AGCS family alanine or glycine:cation symporter